MNRVDLLTEALAALGAVLEADGQPERLVVVGGMAMNLRGYYPRATADVDVIARVDPRSHGPMLTLVSAEPLPEALQEAISRVARDFGLPPDWMNSVVANQWRAGLPPGLESDIEWRRYGGLQVGLVGRSALVALKLFAALDCGPRSVHMQDLIRLAPSPEEMAIAA